MLRSKKIRVMVWCLAFLLALTACAAPAGDQTEPPAADPTTPGAATSTPEVKPTPAKEVKMALLTLGAINDGGWNASIYQGMLAVQEEYGFVGTLVEKINYADMEEVVRTYADAGFDIVIGHANNFIDIFLRVGPEYPDTMFVCTSGAQSQEPNMCSISANNSAQGFLAGCVAGLMTKSGKVAFVCGQESLPNTLNSQGFEMGAKYVNPSVTATTVMTGNNADPVRMKEATNSLIDEGVDIVYTSGNAVALGTVEACTERGMLAIGSNTDQNSVAPDTILVSVVKDDTLLMKEVAERYIAGNLKAEYVNLSVKEGAVYLSPWHGFESKVPQEVKDKLAQIVEGMKAGTIDYEAS